MSRIALPKNSSLNSGAIRYYRDRGFPVDELDFESRDYRQEVGDYEFYILRAQDIPGVVYNGWVDEGITGFDLTLEYVCQTDQSLRDNSYTKLGFGEAELVLAGEGSMPNNGSVTVATSFSVIAEKYLSGSFEDVNVFEVDGSSEVYPSFDGVDMIMEVMETGSTLEANGLRAFETVMETEAVLLKNQDVNNQTEATK